MQQLVKPKKHTRSAYDYNECRDYLEAKYKYDERDYGKMFKPKYNPSNQYLDFWHWVTDNCDVNNGCYIYFSEEQMTWQPMEDWQKEIYKRYLDEFADKNGELEMWVEW